MNKISIITILFISVALAILVGMVFYVNSIFNTLSYVQRSIGGGQTAVPVTASSTTATVTTSSVRLLSTTTKRMAAVIQPINCTVSGASLFVGPANDATAVVNKNLAITASSTFVYSDDTNIPTPTGALQGIVNMGTCSVIVTEYLTNF